jgi:4-carboxymuconolactone decarboxylase
MIVADYGRVHWFEPDELSDDQRAYYDELAAGPRDRSMIMDDRGRLLGAFNSRLLNPALGNAIQQTGAMIRFGDVLTPREREVAILETARLHRSSYEWNAHARAGLKAGLTAEEMQTLFIGEIPGTLDESEVLARGLVDELIQHEDLSDESFSRAKSVLGLPKLFTIVSIVGHYSHTALAMRVWRIPLRDGDADVFAELGEEHS